MNLIYDEEIVFADVETFFIKDIPIEIISDEVNGVLNTVADIDGEYMYLGNENNFILAAVSAYESFFEEKLTKEELEKDFKYGADYYILNAGEVASDKNVPDVGLDTCVALNFGKQKMVILGSQYAG